MIKRKNGFTLIELLAVIVILAIIALIATPIILNIISDTKEEASLRSANFYLEALELSIAQSTLDGQNITDGMYNILDNGNICLSYEDGKEKCAEELELEVKGEIINKGTVTIKTGQIDKVSLVQNNKIIEKDDKGELTYKKITAPKSFAEDEWDTIIDNVKIGNTSVYEKNLKDNINNTNKIKLTIDGTEKEYTVRIANTSIEGCDAEGFSQTACGFVVEFVDIITTYAMNLTRINAGGWRDSEMRKYINNDILNSFPENIRKNILTTYTVSGYEIGVTENYKTYDKLYLLSAKELWGEGEKSESSKDQSRQFDYYSNLKVTKENYGDVIKKNLKNNSVSWWLRSASPNDNYTFYIVTTDGGYSLASATVQSGIAVAFRL